MSLNNVSTILWRERQLLELLLFKLEVEQLLLAASRARWLARATNEGETVLEEIKNLELARSIEVQAVAHEVGLGTGVRLGDLIDASPSPWIGIFGDHRGAFLAITQEILSVAGSNRKLLTSERRLSEFEDIDPTQTDVDLRLQDLGISESRISHMRSEAMSLMREAMQTTLDLDEAAATEVAAGVAARRRAAYCAAVATPSDYRMRLDRAAPIAV